MDSSLIPAQEFDFFLNDWLGLKDRTDPEIVAAFLELSEKLATDTFLSCYKLADQQEPELHGGEVTILPQIVAGLEQYAGLGFFSAGFPEELGGLDMPALACAASFAQFAAANVAMAAYSMLTVANARLICAFGTSAQIDLFAKPQIAGEWFGTMCLSEPQAGSSLADVCTRAVEDGQDDIGHRYRLSGNKMWISGGDHDASGNIVHLVLAKIAGEDGKLPRGSKGLSLFIVPKTLPDGTANDIAVAGINHKMGYRGTANCLLNFGEAQGALGWRVGETGQGLRQMFMMMNEARINVGLGAAAVAYRSYRLASTYAEERKQGRTADNRTGDPVAIKQHPDVKQMLLAQKAYAEGALALCLYCADLVEREDDCEAAQLLGLLTPVTKTWPSEFGLACNDLAIQIHGGYGYTRDFDVEQLYRDNRLNPIHEGTTGIQGLDLLLRKVMKEGDGLAVFSARLEDTAVRAQGDADLAQHATALREGWDQIQEAIAAVSVSDTAFAIEHATAFLRSFGHVVLAWIWLDLALAARMHEADPKLAQGKLWACHYFYLHELAKVRAWLKPIRHKSNLITDLPGDLI